MPASILRAHDLKHTGVALLAAAGADPKEVSRRAGHSSVAFTYDRYGHLFPEADRTAAIRLDALRQKNVRGPVSGTDQACPTPSAESLPRLYAADLDEGSSRRANKGAATAHTRCTQCRHLLLGRPRGQRTPRPRPRAGYPGRHGD